MTSSTASARKLDLAPSAPARNRIRLHLTAPVAEVWALVGDLARLPEYSAGLERVEVSRDARGRPTEFVCHFKADDGGAPIVSRDFVLWHEAGRGWASTAAEPASAFGTRNEVHQVSLEPSPQGTMASWVAHYDAADLATHRAHLDQALGDIAARLIARFGGQLLERFVDGDG
jgi:hypothetical protein